MRRRGGARARAAAGPARPRRHGAAGPGRGGADAHRGAARHPHPLRGRLHPPLPRPELERVGVYVGPVRAPAERGRRRARAAADSRAGGRRSAGRACAGRGGRSRARPGLVRGGQPVQLGTGMERAHSRRHHRRNAWPRGHVRRTGAQASGGSGSGAHRHPCDPRSSRRAPFPGRHCRGGTLLVRRPRVRAVWARAGRHRTGAGSAVPVAHPRPGAGAGARVDGRGGRSALLVRYRGGGSPLLGHRMVWLHAGSGRKLKRDRAGTAAPQGPGWGQRRLRVGRVVGAVLCNLDGRAGLFLGTKQLRGPRARR
mmetsp:Transcript_15984/g.50925  ORF Transcript_15984/g.50925 Transcript_15984/m.50925 type:complete len:311 (+) Transcript_15984:360-1292(+)